MAVSTIIHGLTAGAVVERVTRGEAEETAATDAAR